MATTDGKTIFEGYFDPKLFEEPMSFTFIPKPGGPEIHMMASLVEVEDRENAYGRIERWYHFEAENGYTFSLCPDNGEIEIAHGDS